ncbi:MAG TPA: 5-bromo-4-chloroindolyl phosphate hydrolysis family protein [Candidatus Gemmiger faecigallinarum]|nr:5-bromo-4-chloroindolyl phosphate hydrolysis family protein [Candidatus Gemmiger faecigallinarum]
MPNESHPEESRAETVCPDAAAAQQPAAETTAQAPRQPRRKRAGTADAPPERGAAAQPQAAPRYQQGPAGQPGRSGQRASYNSGRPQRRQAGTPLIPWWVVMLAFIFATPVGIGLFILNVILNQQNQARPNRRGQAFPYAAARPAAKQQAKQGAQQRGDPDKSLSDKLMIAGVILAAIGGLGSAAVLFEDLWILTSLGDIAWFLEEFWPVAMMLFAGLGLCFASQRVRTSWLKRRKIANIVGDADHMYIADIAASLGCSVDKCVDHLENCIDKGVFGPGAYLDMRSMALVVRGSAPQPKNAPEPPPAPKQEETEAAKGQAEDSRYEKILQELRRVNDAIPDEEMSAKISRLETLSAKIFEQIQDDPDKLPQLRKFMDYYLPTSLKLLDTYAELEAQGIEGENISESKRRIEQSMDTLVTAFENQLDKLFQDDALDVSADIEVMEKMLYADGLAGDSDPFGLHSGR